MAEHISKIIIVLSWNGGIFFTDLLQVGPRLQNSLRFESFCVEEIWLCGIQFKFGHLFVNCWRLIFFISRSVELQHHVLRNCDLNAWAELVL